MKNMSGCISLSIANTWSMTGENKCCSSITATIAKNTTSKAVKGSASSNEWPMRCSSTIPLSAVSKTITIRPTRPTEATWNASDNIKTIPTIA